MRKQLTLIKYFSQNLGWGNPRACLRLKLCTQDLSRLSIHGSKKTSHESALPLFVCLINVFTHLNIIICQYWGIGPPAVEQSSLVTHIGERVIR